jgi:hypothetical protein
LARVVELERLGSNPVKSGPIDETSGLEGRIDLGYDLQFLHLLTFIQNLMSLEDNLAFWVPGNTEFVMAYVTVRFQMQALA